MRTVCVWCRREGRTPADSEDPAVITGLCEDHISRFTSEVDAVLRGQGRTHSDGDLPSSERLHRASRRVREAILERVSDVLVNNARTDLCDACMAAEIAVSVGEVEAAATRLAASADFLRDEWRCGRCGVRRVVTRARARPARSRSASPSTAA